MLSPRLSSTIPTCKNGSFRTKLKIIKIMARKCRKKEDQEIKGSNVVHDEKNHTVEKCYLKHEFFQWMMQR